MTDYPTESCRSCSARIVWASTERGKAMPIDAEPSPAGTIALVQPSWQLIAKVLKVAEQFGRTDLHTSHFATCPQARSWRRKRGAP